MSSDKSNEFYILDDDLIDFTGILSKIVSFWKYIIGVSALFVIVTIPFSLSLTPYYRATVLMAPAEDPNSGALSALQSQLGGLSSFIGAIPASSGTMNIYTSLAILKSRTFTDIFIDKKDLLPVLFEEKWDSDKGDWKSGKPPTRVSAHLLMDQIRFTNYDNQQGLIRLSLEWTDPETAAQWTNSYIALLNDYVREQAKDEAQRSIDFLEKELMETSVVSLQTVLFGMIEQQTQTIMLADARIDYAFKIIDKAVVPDERSRPNRTIMVIIAAFAGFSLSLFTTVFYIYTLPFIKRVLGMDESEPLFNIDKIPFLKRLIGKDR